MQVRSLFRKTWLRLLLRGVHYSDRHAQLDLLYRMPDPWQLDCEREHHRFRATNAIVLREFGRVGSLLEIGCGEGLQSSYLSKVCERLRGIDISPVAADRARLRCPNGDFRAADLMAPDYVPEPSEADLVVACEVLYYVRDLAGFIDRMSASGRACLVSYDTHHRTRLEAALGPDRTAKSTIVSFDGTDWVVTWWRNPAVAG